MKIYIELKFQFLITMEDKLEFDLELLNEEHRELDSRDNISSSDDSDEVRGVKRQKIRIIDNECKSDDDEW